MKILISDYKACMMTTHDYEIEVLKFGLPEAEIEIYEYSDEKREEFLEKIQDVTALLTGFIKVDAEILTAGKMLKCISINATGYDNVDLETATKLGIGVFPVGEYCTKDVAEHTIACMLMLNKNIKHYINDIDYRCLWKYDSVEPPKRIESQTLGIFGLGKIGKRVAVLAKGLGMSVIACDPYISKEVADSIEVNLVTADEIFEKADIIANHMNLELLNTAYFTKIEFSKMKKRPIFLNLGRGLSLNEVDLSEALDKNLIRGAAVDVLYDENPKLKNHILANRDNVIITPHSAFYSIESMVDLQRISCENLVYYLQGKKEKVFKLVNIV